MLCCPNCFAHPWLRERVREISTMTGACDFCSSEDVPTIEAGELGGPFDNLLSMYVPADSFESGEPLVDLVQWHWEIFDEDALDRDARAQLLEEIANSDWDDDDGEPMLDAGELYSPLGDSLHTTHRERWEQFCSDVRGDPNEALPFEEYFREDFAQLGAQLPAGTALYHARRGFEPGEYGERRPFRGSEIAAPPIEKAHAARANVEGQRVLYCADQEKTAIAEIRSPLGFYVSVGTLRLNREARMLDLTKEIDDLNPFVTEWLRWHVE